MCWWRVLEKRKLQSRGEEVKLTRKEGNERWREMRNRRRRIADRMFAFSRREDRDRALMSGGSRGMDALVQNWRSGEDARNQQRERAGQCKQFSAGTGVRCAPVHSLAELSQPARN